MKEILIKTLLKAHLCILKQRYKIKLKNFETLKSDETYIFLPNHEAVVDPQILFPVLRQKIDVIPLVDEGYFKKAALHRLFKSLDAISVPDLEKEVKNISIDKLNTDIQNALKSGKSILLYPEGRTMSEELHRLFGRKLAFEAVKSAPRGTKIVLVRIKGLWGSIWSRAWTGKPVEFVPTFLKSLFILLANFIILTPKRSVNIEFIDITKEALKYTKDKSPVRFNKFLETIYNAKPEKLNYVKHFFFQTKSKKKAPEIVEGSSKDLQEKHSYNNLDENIYEFVKNLLEEKTVFKDKISINSNLFLDLALDSIDVAEIYSILKDKYKINKDTELHKFKTVADFVAFAQGILQEELKLPDSKLKALPDKTFIEVKSNYDIANYILKTLRKNADAYLLYDPISGSVKKKDFLLKAHVLAEYIKSKTKNERIGIMLPAGAASAISIFAAYLAGKIPVMINWTASKKAQTKMLEYVDDSAILSASKLYEKSKENISDELKNRLLFLDKEAKNIKVIHKIKGLIKFILHKIYPPHFNKEDDVAVILFTSGTESLPKAVPLTHKNIISNLQGAFDLFKLRKNEILFSFLPPFHSFGFTVTTIFPLVSGLPTAYFPDPNDSNLAAKTIEKSKATITASAPSFLEKLLNENKEKIKTLKKAIVGAEKASKLLFKKAKKNKLQIFEGYGITECSPVISVNPSDAPKQGSVGKILPNLEYKILNKNGQEDTEGVLHVCGPSVFLGYLDDNKDPFKIIDGKKYYNAGDIVKIDNDKYLYIRGRQKRFVKISGEMISLQEIEQSIIDFFEFQEDVKVAVIAQEHDGKKGLTLASNKKLDLNEVNEALLQSGVSKLVKIEKVIYIEEFPLLGSGKIDYKTLENYVKDNAN